jgi:hypothetical protein
MSAIDNVLPSGNKRLLHCSHIMIIRGRNSPNLESDSLDFDSLDFDPTQSLKLKLFSLVNHICFLKNPVKCYEFRLLLRHAEFAASSSNVIKIWF